MAGKQASGSGGKEAAPVADRPDAIRNVALVGPAGSGKTTLVETLLVSAGVLNRSGSTTEGTTVCDFDEAEVRQQRSVGLALAPLVHEGVKINLLDTPGYADFVGELRAGLRAADCAMFVIAANEGVDEPTRSLWRECAEVGMPRVVVITKLDHARADYDGVVQQAREAFGDKVAAGVPPRGGRHPGRPALRRPGVAARSRGPARRAHRGRHRGVRGRDADGALPRRRGGRRASCSCRTSSGPSRAGRSTPSSPSTPPPAPVPRAARPGGQRLPVTARAPDARGVHARPASAGPS